MGRRVSNRDITKLKTAEKELSELSIKLKNTNEILKDLVEQRTNEITTFMTQCPYPRAVYDKDGKLINCNPVWKVEFSNDSDNIYDLPLIKNSNLDEKIKNVFRMGDGFKSHPIYHEAIDKMLILDFYSIRNSKYEIEKIVLNVEDITEQTKSKELSKELETRKDLIGEIFDFLDAERRHISKELHDRIGQNLMLIKMNAEIIKEAKMFAPEKSDEIVELTLQTSKEIKEIIYSLYPEEIEKYGLKESIRNMTNRISNISDLEIELNFYGDYNPLNKRLELSIFRVVQEAFNNISKHSKANKAILDLHFKSNIIQGQISDDGIGFDQQILSVDKFGIKFMEERIDNLDGYLELNSKKNEGTIIHFEIPLK